MLDEVGEEPSQPKASEHGEVGDGHLTPIVLTGPAQFDGTQEEFERQFPLPATTAAKAVGAGLIAHEIEGKTSVDVTAIMELGRKARMRESLPSYKHCTDIVRGKNPTVHIDLDWIGDEADRFGFLIEILNRLHDDFGSAEALAAADAVRAAQTRGELRLSIYGRAHMGPSKGKPWQKKSR